MRSLVQSFPTAEVSLNEYDVLFTLSDKPERRMRLRELALLPAICEKLRTG